MRMNSLKLKLGFFHRLAIILAMVSIFTDTAFPRLALAQTAGQVSLNQTVANQLPAAGERKARRAVPVVLTAYSSTPGQTDSTPFNTSNGLGVYDGLLAANWLPYGTRVKFPELFGDKIFTVNDRMHPRYGAGRVDLWLDAPIDTVKEFGVKRVRMEIY